MRAPGLAGVVTADADGQHHPQDIERVGEALMRQPGALILGSRDFGRDVPLRSRFGNIATRGIMHALLGQKLTDTQTGLRGIPANFLSRLMRMNHGLRIRTRAMLIAAHELEIPMVEVPIRTIYEEGNKSSHFNPIVDSMKIYFVLLRFGSVSMLSAAAGQPGVHLAGTAGTVDVAGGGSARFRCDFNYTMVRSSVFYSRQKHQAVLPKYLMLVVVSGTASYAGIQFVHQGFGVSPIPAKLLVETVLFFVNFAVQRLFIFKGQEGRAGEARGPVWRFRSWRRGVGGDGGGGNRGLATTAPVQPGDLVPDRMKRFVRYGGAYLAIAVPLLAMFPGRSRLSWRARMVLTAMR